MVLVIVFRIVPVSCGVGAVPLPGHIVFIVLLFDLVSYFFGLGVIIEPLPIVVVPVEPVILIVVENCLAILVVAVMPVSDGMGWELRRKGMFFIWC